MLQLDDLSSYEWQNIHASVDRAIADAALSYLRQLHIRRVDGRVTGAPQTWSEELDELTMQREPAYNMPGVPLIYALRYMVKRVTSIAGALARVSGAHYATSVLDVGSGTGATTVALDLMNMPRHISLVGVEPNTEMTEFAEYLRLTRVSARYLTRPLADLAELQRSLDRVHLVVFSATFPYGFDDWSALADAMGNYEEHKDKLILAIEPDAKSGLLDEFQIVLRKRGWPTARFCCHDLPDLMKQDLPLPELTNVWRRLGSPGPAPRSWWNPPDDRFLIANPHPSWPSSGERERGTGSTLARAFAHVRSSGA